MVVGSNYLSNRLLGSRNFDTSIKRTIKCCLRLLEKQLKLCSRKSQLLWILRISKMIGQNLLHSVLLLVVLAQTTLQSPVQEELLTKRMDKTSLPLLARQTPSDDPKCDVHGTASAAFQTHSFWKSTENALESAVSLAITPRAVCLLRTYHARPSNGIIASCSMWRGIRIRALWCGIRGVGLRFRI